MTCGGTRLGAAGGLGTPEGGVQGGDLGEPSAASGGFLVPGSQSDLEVVVLGHTSLAMCH